MQVSRYPWYWLLVILLLAPGPLYAQEVGSGSAQTATSSLTNLDLSSTAASVTFQPRQAVSVNIQMGDTTQTVSAGQMLTPAQVVAAYQVMHSGAQSILLGAQGNAVGGTVNAGSWMNQHVSDLVIPQGVTMLNNIAKTGQLTLPGNLTNAGNFYSYSTNTALTNAVVNAANIVNQQSGLISTMLPAALAGASSVSNPSLTLNAINNIVNAGQITSSGNLSLTAGGTITNATSSVMQAMGAMNLAAQVINNAGVMCAMTGNINVNAVMQNLVLNNSLGRLEALNGQINVNNAYRDGQISLLGGDFLSRELNIFGGEKSRLTVNTNRISGLVNATGCDLSIGTEAGGLNINSMDLSGDPIIYSLADGAVLNLNSFSAQFVTNGDPFIVLSGGDINYTGANSLINTESGSGSGGTIVIAAGVTFTPSSPTASNYTITGQSNSGGSVNLAPLSLLTNSSDISVTANKGVNNTSDGNINIGYITATGSNGAAGATGQDGHQGGAITLNAGGALTAGDITSRGGEGGNGADGNLDGGSGGRGGAGGALIINVGGNLTAGIINVSGGTGGDGGKGFDSASQGGNQRGGDGGTGGAGGDAGSISITAKVVSVSGAISGLGGAGGSGGLGGGGDGPDVCCSGYHGGTGGFGGIGGKGSAIAIHSTQGNLNLQDVKSWGGDGGSGRDGGTGGNGKNLNDIPGTAGNGGYGGWGGNGAAGGESLAISLESTNGLIQITGALSSKGGAGGSGGWGHGGGDSLLSIGGAPGRGGNGGSGAAGGNAAIVTIAAAGGLNVSGDVEVRGGAGGNSGGGGSGGQILGAAGAAGGGDAGNAGLGGHAGQASGSLAVTVRSGAVTAGNVNVVGGNGGQAERGGAGAFGDDKSGNGGDGGNGGVGGDAYNIAIEARDAITLNSIALMAGNGGNAGEGGSASNSIIVAGNGGDGGNGGAAGNAFNLNMHSLDDRILVHNAVGLVGGNGGSAGAGKNGSSAAAGGQAGSPGFSTPGGAAGTIFLIGTRQIQIDGNVSNTGGTGGNGGTGGSGGSGGDGGSPTAGTNGADGGVAGGVILLSGGDILAADITTRGGNGGSGGRGGSGGDGIEGVDGESPGSGGLGGNSGSISISAGASLSAGAIQASGGAGGDGGRGGGGSSSQLFGTGVPHAGGAGGNGGDALAVRVSVGESITQRNSNSLLNDIASFGGDGGTGGDGGNGGSGPDGRTGGWGGNGGDGGHSSNVSVFAGGAINLPGGYMRSQAGSGGRGGAGGDGGNGASPGNGGDGGDGGKGNYGDALTGGAGGDGGAAGHLLLIHGDHGHTGSQGQSIIMPGDVVVTANTVTALGVVGGSAAIVTGAGGDGMLVTKPRAGFSRTHPGIATGITLTGSAGLVQSRDVEFQYTGSGSRDISNLFTGGANYFLGDKDLVLIAEGSISANSAPAGAVIESSGGHIVVAAGAACCMESDTYSVGLTAQTRSGIGGDLNLGNSSNTVAFITSGGLVFLGAAGGTSATGNLAVRGIATSAVGTVVMNSTGNQTVVDYVYNATNALMVSTNGGVGSNTLPVLTTAVFASLRAAGEVHFATDAQFPVIQNSHAGHGLYLANRLIGSKTFVGNLSSDTELWLLMDNVAITGPVQAHDSISTHPWHTGVSLGIAGGLGTYQLTGKSMRLITTPTLNVGYNETGGIDLGSYTAPSSGAGSFKIVMSTAGAFIEEDNAYFEMPDITISAASVHIGQNAVLKATTGHVTINGQMYHRYTDLGSINTSLESGAQIISPDTLVGGACGTCSNTTQNAFLALTQLTDAAETSNVGADVKQNGSPAIISIDQTPGATSFNNIANINQTDHNRLVTFAQTTDNQQHVPASVWQSQGNHSTYCSNCLSSIEPGNGQPGITPIQSHGAFDSCQLSRGAAVFTPERQLQVQTQEGVVHVDHGAQAFVIETGHDVSIYNLHTAKDGGIKVMVGSKLVHVPLGRQLVLTQKKDAAFEEVNPGSSIASRNPHKIDFGNGVVGYMADFSILSAIETIGPLSAMFKSKDPEIQKRSQQMLKNAAIFATIQSSAGPYKGGNSSQRSSLRRLNIADHESGENFSPSMSTPSK